MSKLESQLHSLRNVGTNHRREGLGVLVQILQAENLCCLGKLLQPLSMSVRVQPSEQGFDISILENKNCTGMITQRSWKQKVQELQRGCLKSCIVTLYILYMALHIKALTSIQRYFRSHNQWINIYHFVAQRSHLFYCRQEYVYWQTSVSRDAHQNQTQKHEHKLTERKLRNF